MAFSRFINGLLVLGLACCIGCIPSTPQPPSPETPPLPTEQSPPLVDIPDAHSAIRVPMNAGEIPNQAISMPTIALEPMTDAQGYHLRALFPVEGIAMRGTLVPTSTDHWRLAGQFTADTTAFRPGAPSATLLGDLVPGESGSLEFVGNNAEVVITFSAPMPPPDAPASEEPNIVPFALDIEAPAHTQFTIMLLPM